jgi:beta-hydroxylase
LAQEPGSEDRFLPKTGIDWIRDLEANWRLIRDEVEQLRREVQLPALIEMIPGERSVADARWKMFVLQYFGRAIPRNCAACPQTAALVRPIPDPVSANISILEPGARIAPHHGIFAGLLRYHLGLSVPGRIELCGLRVDGETRHWHAGESLLFDETRRHEAWNLTDEDRVVLLVDVKRPLPMPVRRLNEALLAVLSRFVMAPLADPERMIPTEAPAASAADRTEASRRNA